VKKDTTIMQNQIKLEIIEEIKERYKVNPKFISKSNTGLKEFVIDIYRQNIGESNPFDKATLNEETNLFDLILNERIAEFLNKEEQEIIENTVFCIVEYGLINASTFKYKGYYVVVVNSGLISFINHYLKLTLASIEPNNVAYFGDIEKKENFGFEDYQYFINKTTEYYKKYGIPIGLQIILKKELLDVFALQNIKILILIIGHEIGHIILSHLDKEENTKTDCGIICHKNTWMSYLQTFLVLSYYRKLPRLIIISMSLLKRTTSKCFFY
jgi:hypothetical protein